MPFEAWHGRKPDLSHLWDIGSCAFTLILKHNPKIYEQSFECILVGYSLNLKAYCLYHPSTRLFKSFHVKFIEWKDDVSHPLFPGHIIYIPTAVGSNDTMSTTPSDPTPLLTSQDSSSSPKHTCVQDEEESITSGSNPVQANKIEVPLPLHDNLANIVSAPVDGFVPVPEELTLPLTVLPVLTSQAPKWQRP